MTIRLLTTEELDIITGGASVSSASGTVYAQGQAADEVGYNGQSLDDNFLNIHASQSGGTRNAAQSQASNV